MRAVAIFATCVLLAACGSTSMRTVNATTTTVPGAAACTPLGNSEAADQTMNVTLREWKIEAPAENIARGVTHFFVQNTGREPHNFEVVRGQADDLAKTANGAIDEATLAGGAVLGAVNVPVGGSCDLTVRLTPGPYTLACNLVEAMNMTDVHAHFAKGMHARLDVSS